MTLIREGFTFALDAGLFLLGIVLFLALVVAAGWFVREVGREWESREAARSPKRAEPSGGSRQRTSAETRPESTP